MATWIALLRGVNVGGHNKLPMRPLARDLEAAGLRDVRTYIQSGNLVFESDIAERGELTALIRRVIADNNGFEPAAWLLTRDELQAAVRHNPWPDAAAEPKTLHLYFMAGTPVPGAAAALDALRSGREAWQIAGNVFYLHAPDGIGRSKLAAGADKALGVETTARNWRSVSKLIELAD